MITMQYKHDCDACIPLGRFDDFDFYFCRQHGIPTVIARFGNHPGDYMSGLEFGKSGHNSHLAIAYHMARARGLV